MGYSLTSTPGYAKLIMVQYNRPKRAITIPTRRVK
jgi:hypothetical protein